MNSNPPGEKPTPRFPQQQPDARGPDRNDPARQQAPAPAGQPDDATPARESRRWRIVTDPPPV